MGQKAQKAKRSRTEGPHAAVNNRLASSAFGDDMRDEIDDWFSPDVVRRAALQIL